MKRVVKDDNGAARKRRRTHSIGSIFSHKEDIEQCQNLFKNIQKSHLITTFKPPTLIIATIAEFACGEIRKCDNINCKSDGIEISLLVSQVSHPTLYRKADLLFDKHDEKIYIYCNRCQKAGHRCGRCDCFVFEWQKCHRCSRSICNFCGSDCDDPRCDIKYCVGGDTSSFTSGCGETFLSDLQCSDCGVHKKYCHGCRGKNVCFECRKKKNKEKQSEEKLTVKTSVIYNVCTEIEKEGCEKCKKCSNDADGDGSEGIICNGSDCNIFICSEHCNKYGRFCRGICDKYCCNDCVKKGELKDCERRGCGEVLCNGCKYKCEGCCDFLMSRGVFDDDVIEKVLRDGNFSDYFE